jgi:hypothetical protein
MADNLKEVIAKLKAQQTQNSQNINKAQVPKPAPVKVEIPKETEELVEDDQFLEDDEDEETIEDIKEEPKKDAIKPTGAVSKQDVDPDGQIEMEIALLQNNGRFRAELLNQLNELNRALVVIAGALVDLNGKNTK